MRIEKRIILTVAEREAMRLRCEEDGHSWENACSITFQIYEVCKWCGDRR